MGEILKGRAWVFSDDVDTDLIYHNKYLAETDPDKMPQYAFEYYPGKENFAKEVKPGDFVVAGKNFGCGSSREHAPIALLNMGAAAVLADSFARIFFRNAVNLGLVPVICKGINRVVRSGQTVTLDLDAGTATVLETGECLPCERLGEQAMKILEAGGIKPLMRARFGAQQPRAASPKG